MMPLACCVPFCDSNNSISQKFISIFSFPADLDRKQLWLSNIQRKNLIPSKRFGVCIKHFEKRFIFGELTSNIDCGVSIAERNLFLSKDAYPSVLNFEATSKQPANCEFSDSEDDEIFKNSLKECDKIRDIDAFKMHYHDKLPHCWLTLPSDMDIYIGKIDFEYNPDMTIAMKIHSDLNFTVWYKSFVVDCEEFRWLLGKRLKLKSWTKFESLIQCLTGIDCSSLELQMKGVMSTLNDCAIECADKKVQAKLLSVADHVKFLSFLEPVLLENNVRTTARKSITGDM